MKYRELTQKEIEVYNLGYRVGHRDIIITDIEWDNDEEHTIYRKGYMAGLVDFKRNVRNVSNVSNVSNVHSYNSYNSDKDKYKDREVDKDKYKDREVDKDKYKDREVDKVKEKDKDRDVDKVMGNVTDIEFKKLKNILIKNKNLIKKNIKNKFTSLKEKKEINNSNTNTITIKKSTLRGKTSTHSGENKKNDKL